MILILLLSGLSSISIAADMQVFPNDGLKNTKIEWFHTLHFFNNSKDASELSVDAVNEQHGKIDKILDAGKKPIGAVNTWIFPDFASAPKVPGPEMHMGVSVVREDAIPSFDDPEYKRLVEVRAEIFESIASEFSEVTTWIIGYEGNYVFKDLKGEDLGLDSYVTFLLDTLESATQAIKKANADAIVIGHFLGRWGIPLKISGKVVQSSEILAGIDKEIADRGTKDSAYFDQMITDLVPSLADDRVEEKPSRFYGVGTRSAGWNTKWIEDFSTDTSDLTTYTGWEDLRTDTDDVFLETVVVDNGFAECVLNNRNKDSFAGGKTNGLTVAPSPSDFDSSYYSKNYWTAVMDFDPFGRTNNDTTEHAGVFLRVNDRTWYDYDDYEWDPNQTRFGTIVYTNGTGKMQLTGDDSGSDAGLTYLETFSYFDPQPFIDQHGCYISASNT